MQVLDVSVERVEKLLAPVVLVVDDEPGIQIVLNRLLRLNGCLPRLASCLREVTAVAETERVDAFLIDMTLSGGESGLDVLAWVRRQPEFSDTPVLVFSGLAVLPPDDEAFIRALRGQIFYKTDTLRLAVEAVKRLLADRHAY